MDAEDHEKRSLRLTVADVARQLRVDEGTVRAWIRRGELPAVRLPGRRGAYRIDPRDVALVLAPARRGRP